MMKHTKKDDFAPWRPDDEAQAPVEPYPAPYPALAWIAVFAFGACFWYLVL